MYKKVLKLSNDFINTKLLPLKFNNLKIKK